MLKKRLFSLLLAISMLLTWIPSAAGAVTFDPLGEGPVRYLVDGVTRSGSLQTAWNAAVSANRSATVTLRQDLTGTGGSLGTGAGFRGGALLVPKGKQITLDLAGRRLDRQLTAAGADGSVIIVEGELVLKDSNDAARGAVMGGNSTTAGGGITVAGGGVLKLEGGNITGNQSQLTGAGGIDNRGTVEMSGGKVTANRGGGFRQGGSLKISGAANIAGNNDTANLYLPVNKTVTVGGTLTKSARIGVTTEQLPAPAGSLPAAVGSVSEAYLEKIVADQSMLYKTAFEDGQIVVRNLVDHAPVSVNPASAQNNAPQQTAAAAAPVQKAQAKSNAPAVPVQVSFYLNYVTSGGAPSTITVLAGKPYGSPQSGLFPADPTRDGYVFDGWYTSATNGQGAKVTRDTIVSNTNAHSLYARWKAGQVSVFFDAQGGTVSPTSMLASIGEPYGTLPVPTMAGRQFLGWYTAPEGGQEVTAATVVKQQYEHTLYAMWGAESKPWLVSFHNLDDSGNDAVFIDATGADGKMTLPTPAACGFSAPEGKTFAGWSSSWNGLDITPAGAVMSFTQNSDLYAVWQNGQQDTQDPSETPTGALYTVTYLLDGTIEGEAVIESREENKTFQLMDNPTVKTGYHFVGWSNEGKIYKVNEGFQMPSHDVTFTAVWEAGEVETVTVSFDANYEGAPAVNPASKEVTIGQKYGELPNPTRNGYSFDGWYTEPASDRGVLVTADDTVRFTSDHVLYAHWTNAAETKQYAITLKGNGGTVNGKDEDVFYRDEGEAYSDGLVVPIREGYTFRGWYDGNKVVGASTPATKDTTLEAHWTEGEDADEGFLITFDANDDSGRQFTRRTEADGWMDLPECEFEPIESDIVFDVWTLDPQNEYRMSNRFRFKNDAIIYARWKHPGDTVADPPATQSTKNLEEKQEAAEQVVESKVSQSTKMKAMNAAAKQPRDDATVQITLHPGNGVGSNKTVDVTLDENNQFAEPECPTDFTAPADNQDYEFKGWSLNENDSTLIEFPHTFSDTKTLYAVWGERDSTPPTEQFTITFHPTDGTGSMEQVTEDKDAEYTLPDNGFTKPQNKVFAGWAVGAADASEVKQPGEKITITANVDLYAAWETGYKVSFDANYEGAPAPTTKTYKAGEKYSSQWDPEPEREGYHFMGWLGELGDGSKRQIQDDETVEADSPKSLVAYWAQDTVYTITFDENGGTAGGTDDVSYMAPRKTAVNGTLIMPKCLFIPPKDKEFDTWATKLNNQFIPISGTVTFIADTTVYAIWKDKETPDEFTITLKANNGTAEADKTVTTANKALAAAPDHSGFTAPADKPVFKGWALTENAAAPLTFPHTFEANAALFAIWGVDDTPPTPAAVHVTFDVNHECVQPQTLTLDVGGQYLGDVYQAAFPSSPTWQGFTFDGWSLEQIRMTTSGVATGTRLTENSIVQNPQAHIVYANWKAAAPIKVTFQNSEIAGNSVALQTDQAGNFILPQPGAIGLQTPECKEFDVWEITTGARATERKNAGETFALTSDMTITAIWKDREITNPVTVTFNENYGETPTAKNITYNSGDTFGTYKYTPTRADGNYRFDGWFDAAENGSIVGDNTPISANQTVYAHWTPAYKITYALPYGIGSGTMPDGQAFQGEPFPLPECTLTPPSGYRFNGWSIGDVKAAQVPAGSTHTFTADTTVYATWIMTGSGGSSGSGSSGGGVSHPIWDGSSKPGSSGSIGGSDSEQAVAQVILNASAGTGGTISPSGQVRVDRGHDQEFTITPSDGYTISDVLVDNSSVGAVSRYTFNSVQRAHTIQASFAPSAAAQADPPADTNVTDTTGTADYLSCTQGYDCPIMFYSDIVSGGWYHDGVHYCLDSSLMSGTSATRFEPTARLTRAMLAQIIYNQAGRPSVSGGNSFADVVSGAWYESAVNYAVSTGLMAGYENGNYGPNDPITREQLVVVLWRHAGSPASGVSVPLSDFFETRAYADEAMRWAYGRGIISGKASGLLDPSGQATRVEVAQMLKSYFV